MNAYLYWQQELAQPGCNRRDTDRQDLCGFYRIMKVKTKPDLPVAIWSDDGVLKVRIGRTEPIDRATDEEKFDYFFSTNWMRAVAIPEEQYREVMGEEGPRDGWWPRDAEGWRKAAWVHEGQELSMLDVDYIPSTPASEGGNADDADVLGKIKADIERNIKKLETFTAITTIEQAQAYTNQRDILNALHKRADAARVAEKRPHDDAANAVQQKWKPIVDAAKKYADFARDTAEAWQREQDRINKMKAEEEARRVKLENERRANEHAEAQRLAEREAEAKADSGEFLPEVAAVPEPEFIPAPVTPPPTRVAGSPFSSSRKARVQVSGNITDQAKLIAYLVEQKDAGLLEFLQNRANAAAKAKISLPGVERVES